MFFFLLKNLKKQSIRKLALALVASSAPSFEGLRAIYRALGVAHGVEEAPSLEEALSGRRRTKPPTTKNETAEAEAEVATNPAKNIQQKASAKDPALAARLQALQDASDQRAYDACVADLTANERRASARSGAGLSSSLATSASAAGLALAASAGTGYAAGFVAGRALFPDDSRHPAARFIGGLIGLVGAITVEAGLVIVRAVRAEREDRRRMEKGQNPPSSPKGTPLPKVTRRLSEAELAAEAEVAAAVVAGAATAARAGAEGKAAEAAKAAEVATAAVELEVAEKASAGNEKKKQR